MAEGLKRRMRLRSRVADTSLRQYFVFIYMVPWPTKANMGIYINEIKEGLLWLYCCGFTMKSLKRTRKPYSANNTAD